MRKSLGILLSMLLILPGLARGEVVQIKTENLRVEKESVTPPTSQEIIEIQKIKQIVLDFITGDIDKKKSLLGKNRVGNTQSLDSVLAPFQHESIQKIDFQKASIKGKAGSIKSQLYWFSEGYEGNQTVYFLFSKDAERGWLINWVIY